jgi:hypothetical protein
MMHEVRREVEEANKERRAGNLSKQVKIRFRHVKVCQSRSLKGAAGCAYRIFAWRYRLIWELISSPRLDRRWQVPRVSQVSYIS